ncbi:hypothetical protein [Actinomadura sp. DC4]|uniref:hypothetical protein n=1 Tax=Actinomadura sp. DC4 TaxID=3055069 RepID=UPI0025AF0223|nr:hypothetical protein [Actinomadura sp. DC4]MDN3358246.1 hypothetical protein [Actinomadura sp. DC4]
MVTDARRACHWTLLRLAGRLPDGLLTASRRLLAQGGHTAMARLVTLAVAGRDIPLHRDDLRCLGELLDGAEPPAPLGDPAPGDPMPRHRFFAARPFPGTRTDRIDQAAVAACRAEPDARGLWRAWRVPADDGHQTAKPVFVVETDADPAGLAGRMQDRLTTAGELYPQVETYETGAWLPAYQRSARGAGELLWSRTPDPGVRIAPLPDEFLGIGPSDWGDTEPIENDEERIRILSYLDAGSPVLITTARLHDVIDQDLGRVVPMSFRTDGAWIWTDISAYYLRTYGLSPGRDLVAHVTANGYRMPEVDGVAEFRAISVLYRAEEEDATAGGRLR